MSEPYLFRGCLIPTRLPFLERSSLFVLDRLGIGTVPMQEASCCVEPIGLRSLAEDTWLAVATRMLAIAERDGRDILSLCNGCYLSLEEARQRLGDKRARDQINAVLAETGLEYRGGSRVFHFAEAVRDAGEEHVRQLAVAPQTGLRIASHPGCHLLRPSSRVNVDRSFAPRLLQDIASWCGAEPVFTEDWPKCCGGGIAGVDENVSMRMLDDAASGFRAHGANCILTPCPFCFVQFDIRQKNGLPVLYLSELLALAFGASADYVGLKYHRTKML